MTGFVELRYGKLKRCRYTGGPARCSDSSWVGSGFLGGGGIILSWM